MRLTWKTIIGLLLIIAASSELTTVLFQYRDGVYEKWPWGVEIGFLMMVLAGIFLIRSSNKK